VNVETADINDIGKIGIDPDIEGMAKLFPEVRSAGRFFVTHVVPLSAERRI
jgi:hypothetical protein